MQTQTNNDSAEYQKLIDICHSNLRNSKECLRYLAKERGLDKESIIKHKIGFFPQNVLTLKKYVSEEILVKSSIINYGNSSDFADYFSLIFPIFSEYGEAIGISGRSMIDEDERKFLGIPKYKNSSYKKSNNLYGLNLSKREILNSNNVYVLEGYFDLISMIKNGYKNSVAICGTAFSQNHFIKLSKYTDTITFILDSDEAGMRSAERIYAKFLNKGIKLRFLRTPSPHKDVDEYFRSNPLGEISRDFKQIIPSGW
jgi:DNA primase